MATVYTDDPIYGTEIKVSEMTEEDKNNKELYSSLYDFFIEDPTVVSVLRKYESRSEQGMKEYGISLKDNKKDAITWLEELQTELMDATLYIEKAMEEIRDLNRETETKKNSTLFCKMFKWS